MLLGEYEYKVDIKGRLPLPPKFRQEFINGLVLTRGLEPCIVIYTPEEFKKLADRLSNQTVNKSKIRNLNRFIFGSAFDQILDGQGRVALPQSLRSYAQIKDAAIIVGTNKSIELWNPELWNKQRTDTEEQAWQIMESLEGHQ
jgi:MraZ protein